MSVQSIICPRGHTNFTRKTFEMGVVLHICILGMFAVSFSEGRHRPNHYENSLTPNRNGCNNNCICPANYRPFCGSDGVTYSNRCKLECVRDNCDRNLRVNFEGVCPVAYVHDKGEGNSGRDPIYGKQPPPVYPTRRPPPIYPTRHPTRRPPPYTPPPQYTNDKPDPDCVNCACTYDYTPICGTDGVTYGNNCQFLCARNKCNPNLRIDVRGRCDSFRVTLPTVPPQRWTTTTRKFEYNPYGK